MTRRCPLCQGTGHDGYPDFDECGWCKGAGRVEEDPITDWLAADLRIDNVLDEYDG